MRRLLDKLFALRAPTTAEIQAVARKKFGPCPFCGSDLTDHEMALLGSAINSPETCEQVRALEAAVAAGDWATAASIRDWRGELDEVEFHILRCPKDSRFALIKVHSFAELWSNDVVERPLILEPANANRLRATAPLEWWSLGTASAGSE